MLGLLEGACSRSINIQEAHSSTHQLLNSQDGSIGITHCSRPRRWGEGGKDARKLFIYLSQYIEPREETVSASLIDHLAIMIVDTLLLHYDHSQSCN
jgi:hypothetical protein